MSKRRLTDKWYKTKIWRDWCGYDPSNTANSTCPWYWIL